MSESFMTTEGDRSGVEIPEPRMKASNLLDAGLEGLIDLMLEFDDLSEAAIRERLERIQSSLTRADHFLTAKD